MYSKTTIIFFILFFLLTSNCRKSEEKFYGGSSTKQNSVDAVKTLNTPKKPSKEKITESIFEESFVVNLKKNQEIIKKGNYYKEEKKISKSISNTQENIYQLTDKAQSLSFTQGYETTQKFVETLTVSEKGIVDILIVVDDSSSMKQEHQQVVENLSTIKKYIEKTNWQIRFVTTSITNNEPYDFLFGTFDINNTIITQSALNFKEYLESNIFSNNTELKDCFILDSNPRQKKPELYQNPKIGICGDTKEKGSLAAYLALTKEPKWMRPHSNLFIVFISDENDYSQTMYFQKKLLTYLAKNEINYILAGIFAHKLHYFDLKISEKNIKDINSPEWNKIFEDFSSQIKNQLQDQFKLKFIPDQNGFTTNINSSDITWQIDQDVITFNKIPEDLEKIEISYFPKNTFTKEILLKNFIKLESIKIDHKEIESNNFELNINEKKVNILGLNPGENVIIKYIAENDNLDQKTKEDPCYQSEYKKCKFKINPPLNTSKIELLSKGLPSYKIEPYTPSQANLTKNNEDFYIIFDEIPNKALPRSAITLEYTTNNIQTQYSFNKDPSTLVDFKITGDNKNTISTFKYENSKLIFSNTDLLDINSISIEYKDNVNTLRKFQLKKNIIDIKVSFDNIEENSSNCKKDDYSLKKEDEKTILKFDESCDLKNADIKISYEYIENNIFEISKKIDNPKYLQVLLNNKQINNFEFLEDKNAIKLPLDLMTQEKKNVTLTIKYDATLD